MFLRPTGLAFRERDTNGMATISRLLKMIGLFCKRALHKRRYFAKETYDFKEPTNRSHPIPCFWVLGSKRAPQIPMKMPPPQHPPDRKTRLPWCNFKLHQNLNLNLYREILGNLSFLVW